MPRTFSAAATAVLLRDQVQTCSLMALHTTAGIARATDWAFDIDWDGNAYLSLGHILGFSDIVETPDLEFTPLTVSLSAVDQAYVALALQGSLVQQRLQVWRALMQNNGALISQPVLVWEGRMDGVVIEDDPDTGASTVSVTSWSEFGDLSAKRGRLTTDPMQQKLFPGDTFFLYSSDAPKDLPWGQASR